MSVEQKRYPIVAKKTSDQLNCLYCKYISKFSGVRVQELVYLSHATKGFSGQALVDLLMQARENNAKSNVTGILLYDGRGMFMQAIEGDEKDINDLYNKIEQDERHKRLTLLWRNSISKRNFPDWKMGFEVLDKDTVRYLQGFSDFLDKQDDEILPESDLNFAKVLLQRFRETAKQ